MVSRKDCIFPEASRCISRSDRSGPAGHFCAGFPMRPVHQLRPPVQTAFVKTGAHEMAPLACATCAAERAGGVAVEAHLYINAVPSVGIYIVAEEITPVVPAETVPDIQYPFARKSSCAIGVTVRIVCQPFPLLRPRRIFPPVLQVGCVLTVPAAEPQTDIHFSVCDTGGSMHALSERPGRRGGRLDRPQSGQSSGRQNFARSAGPGVIGEHSSVSGISHVSQGLKAIREHDHRQWDFARFIDFEVRYSLTTCLRRRHCRDRNIPYPGRRHCQDRTGAWTYPDISGERIDCISRFMRAESDRIGISAGGLDSI